MLFPTNMSVLGVDSTLSFEKPANMPAADTITLAKFRDTLSRYPALIRGLNKSSIYIFPIEVECSLILL
jgi:hypothetical protein